MIFVNFQQKERSRSSLLSKNNKIVDIETPTNNESWKRQIKSYSQLNKIDEQPAEKPSKVKSMQGRDKLKLRNENEALKNKIGLESDSSIKNNEEVKYELHKFKIESKRFSSSKNPEESK